METAKLKKFAQFARRSLIEQVTVKLKLVQAENSAARRENAETLKRLDEAIKKLGKEQVIERVAYVWFNRFCALRFMDVNRYTRIGVVSPAEGQFQPEILAEAKMGHIDEEMVSDKTRQQIFALLDGKAPSSDPQAEAYRLLVVAACNDWHRTMPFLFERIEDFTELLMPEDLLSGNSILAYTREAMTPDSCRDVEVIGWLYQFYISEKKNEVFEGLKTNKKITPENIPAATQLFTPHWIVRYLVENSLGRLWLLNHPNSLIFKVMEEHNEVCYYIKPDQPEVDFLRIDKPEEIKICDPACGSGHMLTYAFDLLYAIYEEEGYEPAEIPEKILTHNLYGIEIDERAGELAAFALTMKARSKSRRFFSRQIVPNICVLENIQFEDSELNAYMDAVGRDIFTVNLQETLRQFEEADNFGSLINPTLIAPKYIHDKIDAKSIAGKLHLYLPHQKVLQALKQADYLSPKYHVVIANPPYMGSGGMNGRLKTWVKDKYPNSKADLFAVFIERNLDLAKPHGSVAMITMQSWMFLSSFDALRARIIGQDTILSMAHFGARAFDSIGGEVVSTTAFVLVNANHQEYKGSYLRLIEGNSEAEKEAAIRQAIQDPECGWFYLASSAEFKKIPNSPIAYWASPSLRDAFLQFPKFSEYSDTRIGLITGDNDYYIRQWHEVSIEKVGFNYSRTGAEHSGKKWFPQSKGGDFRRWYGNHQSLVNWENDGRELQTRLHASGTRTLAHNFNLDKIFLSGISWTKISSGTFGARLQPVGFLFNDASANAFPVNNDHQYQLLAFLCSKLPVEFLKAMNPTLNFLPGNVASLPVSPTIIRHETIKKNSSVLVLSAKSDWDAYEISWDFKGLLLLQPEYCQPSLEASYQKLRTYWREMMLEMQKLEEENNRVFIDAYGLQDELNEKVDLGEITLTCNPHYRYGGDKSKEALEALLLADTMREFISYAVGCMFGRYALEKPGLILANQGETIKDYLKRIPEPSFPADNDNVIPILDEDWFPDDITERFRKFLSVTFGEEHYEANLAFVEKALNVKNKKNYTIKNYFLNEFYDDHRARYKKRPIYWLFSSPKGSFNALIYMHRYRPDTVSVVLNGYLREFRTKLTSHRENQEQISISASASPGEKTKAIKKIEQVKKMIAELEDYERDILYPLAIRQVAIDLDDGVKVNYLKFGAALKKISGLDAKEE